MVRYTGIFNNTQVDYTDNSPNTVDVTVTITDYANPYNIQYSLLSSGGGLHTYRFTFDSVPDGTCALNVSYSADGGVTWNGQTGGFTSPRDVTVPENVYIWRLYFQCTDYVWDSEAQEVDFELSELPAVHRTIDNDEDKYTPIRSKSYEIQAHTSNDFSILNFKDGTDNQYQVEISIGGETIFTGWLSVSDLRQRFQPDPNVLVLTATDGLGFLKDIQLVDFDGEIFLNENKIIKYIAASLYQTGLQLPIVVEMNIMESTAPISAAGHFYNFCYLHALTFETGINEFDDCYTVLEKIFTENCFVTQEKNVWYIRRIDEVDAQDQKMVRFAYDGTVDGYEPVETYTKELGSNMALYSMGFMNEDAEVSIISAHKSVKHTFNYVNFQEIPCNKTFIRGDFVEDMVGDRKKYELDCWNFWKQDVPGGTNYHATPTLGDAYIVRQYDAYDYETDRYMVMTYPTYPNPNIVESQKIPVDEGDRITFGFTYRFSTDVNSGVLNNLHSQIRLDGDDGSVWFLDDDGIWYESDATWSINYKFLQTSYDTDDVDFEEWIDYSITDVSSIPVSGALYIVINWGNYSALTGRQLWIKDIQFDYIPRINGSYRNYIGHYHKTKQDTNSKLSREKDVFISDNCKRLHKGCLMKEDGGAFVVTEGFYNLATAPTGPPAPEYIKPYGEVQNLDVWNQYNRTFVAFEGTIDGLDTDTVDGQGRPDIPGFMHRFYLRDSSELTNNKSFVPLHFEQDLYLCEWDTYFVEVYDSAIPKNYLGHEFKYIESDTN